MKSLVGTRSRSCDRSGGAGDAAKYLRYMLPEGKPKIECSRMKTFVAPNCGQRGTNDISNFSLSWRRKCGGHTTSNPLGVSFPRQRNHKCLEKKKTTQLRARLLPAPPGRRSAFIDGVLCQSSWLSATLPFYQKVKEAQRWDWNPAADPASSHSRCRRLASPYRAR